MRRLHRPAARPTRRAAGLAGISAAIIGLAACSSGGPTGSGSGSPTAGGGSGTSSSPSTSPSSPSSATSTSPTTPAASATSPVACGDTTAASLTVEQRVGQLLMVGIQPGSAPAGLDATIAAHHLGGAIYLGGWSGSTVVRETSAHLQAQVSAAATGGVRLLVAADQEGGQVQQLKGNGFSSIPSALVQGQSSTTSIQATGALVGRELLAAGVNVDLAPVADTVSSTLGVGNGPIGRYDREFGHDPATTSRGVTAFVRGLRSSGVAATVKHFPGLGRITGNTDTTSVGITDTQATTTDPNLDPFRQGLAAGAQLVMVSTARYPRLDPGNQAAFSPAIITGLLRGDLGWQGVVVTDDVGAAAAVSAIPYGERATRFVEAGGDIVLTATLASVAPMAQALLARYAAEPAFAAKVEASARRALALKAQLGLLSCP